VEDLFSKKSQIPGFPQRELRNSPFAYYAACPDPKYRDGTKAVANATKSCELDSWKNPNHIDTLAAAYAEAGNFAAAIEWQTKALGMAAVKAKSELLSRLELYKARKPYRREAK
jgi:hypothetical protein